MKDESEYCVKFGFKPHIMNKGDTRNKKCKWFAYEYAFYYMEVKFYRYVKFGGYFKVLSFFLILRAQDSTI